MPAAATTPTTAMSANVARQPHCCPTNVPSGTPRTLARVSPPNMIEMAPARRSAGTSEAASTEPMPKNAPCASAATTRPASSIP